MKCWSSQGGFFSNLGHAFPHDPDPCRTRFSPNASLGLHSTLPTASCLLSPTRLRCGRCGGLLCLPRARSRSTVHPPSSQTALAAARQPIPEAVSLRNVVSRMLAAAATAAPPHLAHSPPQSLREPGSSRPLSPGQLALARLQEMRLNGVGGSDAGGGSSRSHDPLERWRRQQQLAAAGAGNAGPAFPAPLGTPSPGRAGEQSPGPVTREAVAALFIA